MKGNRPTAARALSVLLAVCLCAVFALPAFAADEKVEKAIEIAVAIASDDTHGYGDPDYEHFTRDGNPDFDCSSFVCTSFARAGFDVNPLDNVGSMVEDFSDDGFVYVTDIDFTAPKEEHTEKLLRGDILMKDGHVEIYLGWDDEYCNWMMVGAHLDYDEKPGDSGENEVNVRSYYVKAYDGSIWEGVLRYAGAYPAMGDIDNNGEVDVNDARTALRAAVGLEELTAGSLSFLAADADKNGEIGVEDARMILRSAVGLEKLDGRAMP